MLVPTIATDLDDQYPRIPQRTADEQETAKHQGRNHGWGLEPTLHHVPNASARASARAASRRPRRGRQETSARRRRNLYVLWCRRRTVVLRPQHPRPRVRTARAAGGHDDQKHDDNHQNEHGHEDAVCCNKVKLELWGAAP